MDIKELEKELKKYKDRCNELEKIIVGNYFKTEEEAEKTLEKNENIHAVKRFGFTIE